MSVPSVTLAGLPSRLKAVVKVNLVTSLPLVRSLTIVCFVRPSLSDTTSVQWVFVVELQLPPAG